MPSPPSSKSRGDPDSTAVTAAFVTLAVLLSIVAASACLLLGRLDNRLGGDMLADPRNGLQQHLQRWLGIDHLHHHLRRQENLMAQVIDLLNGLIAQDTAASAAQATSFHNIDAAIADLRQAVANQGEATPEVQAAVDKLSAGFASLQKAAEDEGKLYEPADNGDQPVVTPPADGGDTPVDNGGDVPDNGDTGDVPPVVENRKR
jgi:hypothetical protein